MPRNECRRAGFQSALRLTRAPARRVEIVAREAGSRKRSANARPCAASPAGPPPPQHAPQPCLCCRARLAVLALQALPLTPSLHATLLASGAKSLPHSGDPTAAVPGWQRWGQLPLALPTLLRCFGPPGCSAYTWYSSGLSAGAHQSGSPHTKRGGRHPPTLRSPRRCPSMSLPSSSAKEGTFC